MPDLRRFRFTLSRAMIGIAVLGVYMGFFAAFKDHPELIVLILAMGAGYWVFLVLPFYLLGRLQDEARRRPPGRERATRPEPGDTADPGH